MITVFLSDGLGASDIIVLPYRKVFGGASGLLCEGVALGKCIVDLNHGTLGYTIEKKHLGYTFESENAKSLADVLEKALNKNFQLDENYKKYQKSLNPEYFSKSYMNLYKYFCEKNN